MNHPDMLAAFVTPTLAAVGAGAMSVPILIHLLARRRFKRIRWAAMEFLIDAERRNRRRIRMEEWILLALRCLAVFLLGLMVARPFVSPGTLASAWGGSRRTERIIVMDDSFSMGYAVAEDSPFSRTQTAVRRLIEQMRLESPDDSVTILRTSRPQQPLAAGAYLDVQQVDDLLARVEAMRSSQASMDLAAVFKTVADLLGRDAGIVDASLYMISDFQKTDWEIQESGGQARLDMSLTEPLRNWVDRKRALRVYLINVGEEDAVNDAVLSLEVKGGRPVAGTSSNVRVEVAHYGANQVGPVSVSVDVGQREQQPRSVEGLGAFQQAAVEIESTFLRAGDESIRVEIPADALPVDNVRYASAEVVSAVRVLIVSGEPSADEYEDEVALLRTALRPEGEIFSGHEVTVIDEAALEGTNLSTFHAVILANVYRITEPAIEALERFVQAGGGVMFFLGDQVDPVFYSDALFRDGAGILPAAPREVVSVEEPIRMVVTDRLHPALGALGAGEDPLGLGQIPFFEFFATRDEAAETTDPDTPTEPDDRAAGNRPRVIARFIDPGQSPAIIEKKFGEGRAVLVTTTADKEWNLWADHPTYLPVITELLRHIVSAGGQRSETRVGDWLELDIEQGVFDSTVTVRTPGYPNQPEATTSLVLDPDSAALRIRWEQTTVAGIYQFALRRQGGSEVIRFAAVNVDPVESNLVMVDDDSVRRVMGAIPHVYVKGLDKMAGLTSEAKTELWTPVLLLAAVVLMSEQFLAFWWGRNR